MARRDRTPMRLILENASHNRSKIIVTKRSLLRLKEKVERNPAAQNREPSFLAVLVGKATFCRVTPAGVHVVPITELGA